MCFLCCLVVWFATIPHPYLMQFTPHGVLPDFRNILYITHSNVGELEIC